MPAWAWVLVAAVVAAAGAVGVADVASGARVGRSVQALCAVAFTVVAAGRARREPGDGWAALAVFGSVWTANRVGALLMGPPTPRGTMSGPLPVLWIIGVPAGFAGLYRQCFRCLDRSQRWRVVADALVVAAAWLFVSWGVARWMADGPLDGGRSELVMPALEVVAAALVVTAAVHQPARVGLRWAAAALVAAVVGDGTVAHRLVTDRPVGGALVFVAFALTAVCAVRFALVQDPGASSAPLTSPRRRLLSVPLALAVAVGLADVLDQRGHGQPGASLLVALVAVTCLNYQFVYGEIGDTVRRLAASQDQFRTLFEHAPVGIAMTETDGTVLQANDALAEMTGWPVAEVVGRSPAPFVDPDQRVGRLEELGSLLAGERSTATVDVRLVSPTGEERWARTVVARVPDADPPRLISVGLDVTQRRRAEERLAFLASHDPLTALLNRPAFERSLARMVDGSTGPRPAAVVFIDLDQFKVVNDSLGHDAGDLLLCACARRLLGVVGDRGEVARFGGDEFSIVLAPAPEREHRRVVTRVGEVLRQEVDVGGGERSYPTASVGVALWYPGATPGQLLAAADAAMYRAKERGRNRTEWFDAADRDRVAATHRLVQDLHRALDGDELVVHYQPVVEVASGDTIGAEALVRWQHPTRGLLPPAAFLDVAESNGLLVPLGERILAVAAARAAAWNEQRGPARPLSVSVNVAAQQLLDPAFPTVVDRVLTDSGLAARHLWLELTETALMSDARVVGHTLGTLRSMGVRFAVDDFGTGYSSLTYLKRFPVGILKVDRAFVSGLGIDAEDTAIVGAIVDLGHRLGLRVVAEGVETPLQLEALRDLGCEAVQGFLLARPMPADQMEQQIGAAARPGQG